MTNSLRRCRPPGCRSRDRLYLFVPLPCSINNQTFTCSGRGHPYPRGSSSSHVHQPPVLSRTGLVELEKSESDDEKIEQDTIGDAKSNPTPIQYQVHILRSLVGMFGLAHTYIHTHDKCCEPLSDVCTRRVNE